MDISALALSVAIRYTLLDKELQEAAKSLKDVYAYERAHDVSRRDVVQRKRTVSVLRRGKSILHTQGIVLPLHQYVVTVEYDTPIALTQELLQFELKQFEIAHLRSDSFGDDLALKPSGLSKLTGFWGGHKNSIYTEEPISRDPWCEVEMLVPGAADETARRALVSLGSQVYFPERNSDGSWTTRTPSSTQTSGVPHILFRKKFDCAVSPDFERLLYGLAASLRDIIVQHCSMKEIPAEAMNFVIPHAFISSKIPIGEPYEKELWIYGKQRTMRAQDLVEISRDWFFNLR
ncbi:MAG: hypothetical protein KGI50_01220 [Patescibacteria group bacterium]|nr:hypothetical protein [Patescibacteria group bacterium]MDE2438030.1 hypothetical protein [Patescibacteria group bacterium]